MGIGKIHLNLARGNREDLIDELKPNSVRMKPSILVTG
jgi:hypothetical protein